MAAMWCWGGVHLANSKRTFLVSTLRDESGPRIPSSALCPLPTGRGELMDATTAAAGCRNGKAYTGIYLKYGDLFEIWPSLGGIWSDFQIY